MILPSGSLPGAVTVVLASAIFLLVTASLRIIGYHFWKSLPEAKPPPGIEKLTEYVWEFYSPEGSHDREIIFFHGLQLGEFKDAFWETWVTKKNKQLVWPKEWLSKLFPLSRILSVSYDSSATRRAGQLRMYALAENLFHDIILDAEIGQHCPVFLVGHCFGGIVIKHFILFAIKQLEKYRNDHRFQGEFMKVDTFLKNFSGVFYYATPHGGSEVANLASRLPGTSPILELVKTLSTETAIINDDFSWHRKHLDVRAFGMAEFLPPSYIKGFDTLVVVEAATRYDIDYFFTHQTADHFTICKARKKSDPVVIEKLVQFIQHTVPEKYREIANVCLQHEGENTSSPEDPKSHPGSAIQEESEEVKRYVSSVNDKAKPSYSINKKWLDKLAKQDKEALLSAFERNSYKCISGSPTKICFREVRKV